MTALLHWGITGKDTEDAGLIVEVGEGTSLEQEAQMEVDMQTSYLSLPVFIPHSAPRSQQSGRALRKEMIGQEENWKI